MYKFTRRSFKNGILLIFTLTLIGPFFISQEKENYKISLRNAKKDAIYLEEKLPVWPTVLQPSFGSQLIHLLSQKFTVKEEYKFIQSYLPVLLNRTQVVGNFCKSHTELAVPGDFANLAWIIKKNITNIAWCCNFKVGSGTWTTNFLRVGHFNENNPKILALPLRKQDKARFDEEYGAHYGKIFELFPEPKTPEEKLKAFRTSIRFMAVRHPFTRILSGYRNIIESSRPTLDAEPFYQKLRKQIVASYRPSSSKNKSIFPTFVEFISYFINITKPLKTAKDWYKFLIENNGEYWEPFWSHCHVCASDYTVIVKLETMAKDEKFLTILANLKEVKQRKKIKQWKHMIDGKTSYSLAHTYYKQLTRKQLLDLYEIYKYDFQLFSYDINYYLKIVGP